MVPQALTDAANSVKNAAATLAAKVTGATVLSPADVTSLTTTLTDAATAIQAAADALTAATGGETPVSPTP